MPKVSEGFPRKYVNAEEIGARVLRLKIERVLIEQIYRERKWIIYFVGAKKGLVLNRTNAEYLQRAIDDDADKWIGHELDVFTEKVEYEGDLVDGIRISIPKPAASENPADQEIPF